MNKSYLLSWFTLVSAILAGLFYYLGYNFLAFSSLFMITTYYLFLRNGLIKKSKQEIFFQDITSLYAEVFILFGILFSSYTHTYSTHFALFGILLTNHIRIQYNASLIEIKGYKKIVVKKREYLGILPRSNRLIILIFLPLLQYFFSLRGISVYGLSLTDGFMILFALLTNLTAIQRFINAYIQLGR